MNTYYDNMEHTNFDTTVLSCTEVNENYHVILEETAFYPEKGGMAKDTGTLNSIQLLDVFEENNQIIHVSPVALAGHVHGEVDPMQRLTKCQVHTSQHIISYYLESRYPFMTVSHHVSNNSADITLQWQTKQEDIDFETLLDDINQYANDMIRRAIPINILYPSYEEYNQYQKKTDFQPGDLVRVVKLGNEDYNFCSCIHVPNTSFIQLIHVYQIETAKNGILVHYQSGEQLRLDHHQRFTMMKQASVMMKSNEYDLTTAVDKLLNSKAELEQQLFQARELYLDMIRQSLIATGETIVVAEFTTLSTKEGQMLASKLSAQNKIVYLLLRLNERCHVIFASPKGSTYNMKDDYAAFTSKHDFKGGGNPNMAQGGGLFKSSYLDEIRAIANEKE